MLIDRLFCPSMDLNTRLVASVSPSCPAKSKVTSGSGTNEETSDGE